MFPGVTQVHKRLALSGLSHTIKCENLFIFTIQGTHIMYKTLGSKWFLEVFCPAYAFATADSDEARNPQRFIHVAVMGYIK